MFLHIVCVTYGPIKSIRLYKVNPHAIKIFFSTRKKIVATLNTFFTFKEKFNLIYNIMDAGK